MALSVALYVLAGALLLITARYYQIFRGALHLPPPPPTLKVYPFVTVVRPIKGLDVGARENLRAALANAYRGEFETIFVFDDEDEPAVPLAKEAIAAHHTHGGRGAARIVYCGAPPPHRTGKLHAMIAALPMARGQVIAFADSDILTHSHDLNLLVETLYSREDSASAFAPVVVDSRMETAGDVGYALLLNGMYGPAAAFTARRNHGVMPFIMGQFMVWRREAIDAVGGLETAEGQLVDDMYLGLRVVEVGRTNLVAPFRLSIVQHGLTPGEFLLTYVRWLAFSRTGLPDFWFKFPPYLTGAVFWVGGLAAIGATIAGEWLAALCLLAAPIAVTTAINRLHHLFGGQKVGLTYSWVAAALILASPFVMLVIQTRRQVNWRGRIYTLDASSKLASGPLAPIADDDAMHPGFAVPPLEAHQPPSASHHIP